MARVKGGLNAHKRHKKILKQAKGFYGAKSKQFKVANQAVMRSLRSAYIGRKLNQRCSKNERHELFQAYERSQEERNRNQQKDALRDGYL